MSESKAISIMKKRSSSQTLVPLCALKIHDPSTDMRKPTKSSSAKDGPTDGERRWRGLLRARHWREGRQRKPEC